jgi:amidase
MEESSILQLQEKLSAGDLSAVELTQFYLDRIQRIDRNGPKLNSIIEINPDALELAYISDSERKNGQIRSQLHGIPVVLKDNIDTADRMMTTAGSLALEGSTAPHDAFLVERLRHAGAVILAKANLSEWANFRSEHSISGWSSRGGQTRNPYALDRNPCGSSSGSAVAVSANLCSVAIGTETDGSIVCPSQANGIVGIKPTLGLVSRTGIIPISHSQDTAGPMARTVSDAAILLGVIAGSDVRDPSTVNSDKLKQDDYTKSLDPGALKGARIGVARDYFGFNSNVDQIMESAIKVMQENGAEIIDPASINTEKKFGLSEYEVLLFEFKTDLNSYLSTLGLDASVHSLEEIIDFNEKNKDRVMPFFGQERMLKAQAKGPLTSKSYLRAIDKNLRLSREKGIDLIMQKHSLDAIIAPTGGPAWLIDLVLGDHYGGGCSSPPAVAGYPHITLPAGFIHGLPVGISFIGTAYQEPKLIRLAYAFEQATMVRKPPDFRSTVDF